MIDNYKISFGEEVLDVTARHSTNGEIDILKVKYKQRDITNLLVQLTKFQINIKTVMFPAAENVKFQVKEGGKWKDMDILMKQFNTFEQNIFNKIGEKIVEKRENFEYDD
jgi:hypothetical protein